MSKAPSSRPTGPRRGLRPWLIGLGSLVALIVVLILVWSWDWFIPLVDSRASAALHRRTTIAHLHVRLGRIVTVTADDLTIDQPAGFEDEKQPFATARHATVAIDAWDWLRHGTLSLPLIALDGPRADIVRRKDGPGNATTSNTTMGPPAQPGAPATKWPTIGELRITDGALRVADAPLRAEMAATLHTTPPNPAEGDRGRIVVDATGRYAAQPMTLHAVGGALLGLMDPAHPYPLDVTVRNGPTTAALAGTIDDPFHFAGARLTLHFNGPDMSLLYPLTGIPIPVTPAYDLTGRLDYSRRMIRFTDLRGRLGSSDIGGAISVDPHQAVPFVDATLHSHRVDLVDLGGFIGARRKGAKTPAEQAAEAKDPNVLPDTPINIPKLRAINAHLVYHGDHIENRRVPLDNIGADIRIDSGTIDVRRLNFAVGNGTLASVVTLTPAAGGFAARARLDFAHIDLSRIMQATTGTGARGIIGGHATLAATGNSLASLLAHGTGGLTLVLDQGGDLSALLPDMLGLRLGNAVLSALGLPQKTDVQCFIADLPLNEGIVQTRTLLLQTGSTRTLGSGTIDLRRNAIDYALTTRSLHFTVASLPGAFHITGPLKDPTVLPGAEVIGRAAAAAGLGVVMPPLALLPTIQFGVGEGSVCARAVQEANANPAAGIAPGALSHPRKRRR
ncbi:AsmA family protein [Gluconacetobacter diazotrophicus]|uniref:AsmA family protein n=1 Tax=Gluconacetobacter diazotrophicus TaxID=33996 RepID=A0A7W4I6Q5_GLUDI|nr:AsmA family protein [Gluconacetobacter diazotrophicus]MBB2157249.1 AsmA family protein [Gluconacetobacter diazotrophicus]